MDLTRNPKTYVYWLAQKETYIKQVANEIEHTTPLSEFYNFIIDTIDRAPETGRKKTFVNDLTKRLNNKYNSAMREAKTILAIIERCRNIKDFQPIIDPRTVTQEKPTKEKWSKLKQSEANMAKFEQTGLFGEYL